MRVLMHICCGVCAAGAANRLGREMSLVLFFYNPNIWPPDEYMARLRAANLLSEKTGLPLIIAEYAARDWNAAVQGTESEPEGGRRCVACYAHRLERTAVQALKLGTDAFTTTLTISPHKDSQSVNAAGRAAGQAQNVRFLEFDLKKDGGFETSGRISREMGLYSQKYCGCRFSLRANQKF